jgi:hypothetical protein
MKSIELVRRELEAFCEHAIRRGWRIGANWGLHDLLSRTYCPLGAVTIVTDGRATTRQPHHALVVERFDSRCAFEWGFDGLEELFWTGEGDWYRLGQWFRERYFVGNPAVIEVAWEPELQYYVDVAATEKRGIWRVFDTTLEKALDGAHRLLGTAPRGAVEGKLRIKSDQGWVSR